jgi:uncharacterized protein (DUF1330 family)
MKGYYKVGLAVLGGVLMGIAGGRAIQAQAARTKPAYVIAEVEVTDPVALKKYSDKAPQIVASQGGRYVVRGGNPQSLEGDPPKGFIVVIGFDSAEKAREWYDSPEYSAIKPLRQSATKSRLILVEGVAAE